jgi:hypothetical protein
VRLGLDHVRGKPASKTTHVRAPWLSSSDPRTISIIRRRERARPVRAPSITASSPGPYRRTRSPCRGACHMWRASSATCRDQLLRLRAFAPGGPTSRSTSECRRGWSSDSATRAADVCRPAVIETTLVVAHFELRLELPQVLQGDSLLNDQESRSLKIPAITAPAPLKTKSTIIAQGR